MDVLGSPSLIVRTVSVDVKTSEDGFRSELRSCVKVEVDVLGSPSLIVRTVSVDVKQQLEKKRKGYNVPPPKHSDMCDPSHACRSSSKRRHRGQTQRTHHTACGTSPFFFQGALRPHKPLKTLPRV